EYNFRLGYCYLVTSVSKPSSSKYLEAATSSADAKKEWLYYLGMSYMYNEKPDDALKAFNDYKDATNSKPIKGFLSVFRMIEMCRNEKELLSQPVHCKIVNLGKGINTNGDEYNPVISGDNKTLMFTSKRKGNTGGLIKEINQYTSNIY